MTSKNTEKITIIRPDDWHVHLRDDSDDRLSAVAPHTAKQFGRALVMPNLKPPITSVDMALKYREDILEATKGYNFNPFMTLYLTDSTTVEVVQKVATSKWVKAFKLYPAGATTNSDDGVTDIKKVYPIIAEMERLGVVLCIHGEITHGDIFDREAKFIDEVMIPLRKTFPQLKIAFEHITTAAAVNYVQNTNNIMATITPQHLLKSRNDMLVGGIKPHLYCLPILKTEKDRKALVEAATSGDPRFFAGTDSAPHVQGQKESACGCAGCFTAMTAIEFYTTIFDEMDALDKLEGFLSKHGAKFYQVPYNESKITLIRQEQHISHTLPVNGKTQIIPFLAGEQLPWSIQE